MHVLRSTFDLEEFFERVRTSDTRVLMLDYDGTLAPFRDRADEAVPYPGVVRILDQILEAGHTRVVIVSGRWVEDLMPLIGLERAPELWGSHGWERVHVNRGYDRARVPAGARALLAALEDWALEVEALGGRVERKPAGVAFHWRGLASERVAAIRDALASRWTTISSSDLGWHEFDGGIELRAVGRDKGDVVRAIVAEVPERAALAYLGDDLTDEDAFEAMPEHGAALLVRPEFRPTAAGAWIQPPEELIEFLRRWHATAADRPKEERRAE